MTLRVLHTSDWHLGRSLHEEPLLDDQVWALDRLVELARDVRPELDSKSRRFYADRAAKTRAA